MGCCNSTYLEGNKISTSEFDLNDGKTSKLLLTSVAPTISSGFGVRPSIKQNNGASAFVLTVGAGKTATSGVLNLLPVASSWNCWCNDMTTTTATVFMCKQIASTSSLVTLANFSNMGRREPWVPGDEISVSCFAN